jgi:hypothetical protein
MNQLRRLRAGLALAVFAAVAACVVLSAYAQKFADPLAAEVRAEYESHLSLYRMTDISALDGLYAKHQITFLPIVPPGLDVLVQPASPFVIPFDWQNFPEEFNKRLIGEMKHGAPVYFVRVAEDPKTREIVFYNADGEEIYALPPPKDYDLYWFVKSWFPGLLSGRYDIETTDYLLEMYDPSRVQMIVNLVPTENLFDYLTAEAEEAAMLQAHDVGQRHEFLLQDLRVLRSDEPALDAHQHDAWRGFSNGMGYSAPGRRSLLPFLPRDAGGHHEFRR